MRLVRTPEREQRSEAAQKSGRDVVGRRIEQLRQNGGQRGVRPRRRFGGRRLRRGLENVRHGVPRDGERLADRHGGREGGPGEAVRHRRPGGLAFAVDLG
ncbi:MAG: hypothetical protein IJS46_06625, partial [Kiritimatiellae bacterium]|nr:hypothetical protein [Kiritimatiellia bacterium]